MKFAAAFLFFLALMACRPVDAQVIEGQAQFVQREVAVLDALEAWEASPDCSGVGDILVPLQDMAVYYSMAANRNEIAIVNDDGTLVVEYGFVRPRDARMAGWRLGEVGGLVGGVFDAHGCQDAVRRVLVIVPMFAPDVERQSPGTQTFLRLRREQMSRIYRGRR